jgi:hypothetical protein
MKRKGDDELLTSTGLATLSAGLACLIAGVAVSAFVSGFAALLAGLCLVGLAGIALVSFAFVLVGKSEDRDLGKRPR